MAPAGACKALLGAAHSSVFAVKPSLVSHCCGHSQWYHCAAGAQCLPEPGIFWGRVTAHSLSVQG